MWFEVFLGKSVTVDFTDGNRTTVLVDQIVVTTLGVPIMVKDRDGWYYNWDNIVSMKVM